MHDIGIHFRRKMEEIDDIEKEYKHLRFWNIVKKIKLYRKWDKLNYELNKLEESYN